VCVCLACACVFAGVHACTRECLRVPECNCPHSCPSSAANAPPLSLAYSDGRTQAPRTSTTHHSSVRWADAAECLPWLKLHCLSESSDPLRCRGCTHTAWERPRCSWHSRAARAKPCPKPHTHTHHSGCCCCR